MKKGLLLSVVASTMIFAGGDIAPVEPAAPASADFWGQIGFSIDLNDWEWGTFGQDFGDEANNAFSATVVLGVEKELGYGFGFGAELAGWTNFGWNIGNLPRVASVDTDSAEISQAYLTYTFGNTAIKAGRQALPKAVSPWAWSDRSAGVLDWTYDGIVIVNTDIQDTTLVGAWVEQANLDDTVANVDVSDAAGLFMVAAINKSLPNTTLAVSAYYVPESNFAAGQDTWSLWASAVSNVNGITAGVQFAYVDGDVANTDATVAVAGKLGSVWGDFDATLVASYINDGSYSLKTAGAGVGTSAFWGNAFGGFLTNGDIAADTVTQVRVDMGYKLSYGKLYGGIGYVNFGSASLVDDGFGGRIGYAFNVMGVDAKVEYRYATYDVKAAAPFDEATKQRIRIEAFYKF